MHSSTISYTGSSYSNGDINSLINSDYKPSTSATSNSSISAVLGISGALKGYLTQWAHESTSQTGLTLLQQKQLTYQATQRFLAAIKLLRVQTQSSPELWYQILTNEDWLFSFIEEVNENLIPTYRHIKMLDVIRCLLVPLRSYTNPDHLRNVLLAPTSKLKNLCEILIKIALKLGDYKLFDYLFILFKRYKFNLYLPNFYKLEFKIKASYPSSFRENQSSFFKIQEIVLVYIFSENYCSYQVKQLHIQHINLLLAKIFLSYPEARKAFMLNLLAVVRHFKISSLIQLILQSIYQVFQPYPFNDANNLNQLILQQLEIQQAEKHRRKRLAPLLSAPLLSDIKAPPHVKKLVLLWREILDNPLICLQLLEKFDIRFGEILRQNNLHWLLSFKPDYVIEYNQFLWPMLKKIPSGLLPKKSIFSRVMQTLFDKFQLNLSIFIGPVDDDISRQMLQAGYIYTENVIDFPAFLVHGKRIHTLCFLILLILMIILQTELKKRKKTLAINNCLLQVIELLISNKHNDEPFWDYIIDEQISNLNFFTCAIPEYWNSTLLSTFRLKNISSYLYAQTCSSAMKSSPLDPNISLFQGLAYSFLQRYETESGYDITAQSISERYSKKAGIRFLDEKQTVAVKTYPPATTEVEIKLENLVPDDVSEILKMSQNFLNDY